MVGNVTVCGDTTDSGTELRGDAQGLLVDLSVAMPKIGGYFAAAKRREVYAVAQCARTVGGSGCGDCRGRFTRYSERDFFGSNQTVDLCTLLEIRGYAAPEYAIHGQLSEKVDTYRYGVVLLEIIGGRKSNDTRLEPLAQYLLE